MSAYAAGLQRSDLEQEGSSSAELLQQSLAPTPPPAAPPDAKRPRRGPTLRRVAVGVDTQAVQGGDARVAGTSDDGDDDDWAAIARLVLQLPREHQVSFRNLDSHWQFKFVQTAGLRSLGCFWCSVVHPAGGASSFTMHGIDACVQASISIH